MLVELVPSVAAGDNLPTESDPGLDTEVAILPFDPKRKRVFEGQFYFLGIEQIRDVIEGLEEQLGRLTSLAERLRATIHYAKHDAFIDPQTVAGPKLGARHLTNICVKRRNRSDSVRISDNSERAGKPCLGPAGRLRKG
jgi:hypothetical protein